MFIAVDIKYRLYVVHPYLVTYIFTSPVFLFLAYDFLTLNKSGAGDSAPKWNSYVRRRKWRYIEKSNSGSQSLNEYVQY